mgnify:CR=1 FL=1
MVYIAPTKLLQRHTLASFFCTLLLLCQLLISADAEAADTASQYAIVVSSAPGTNLKWVPKKHSLFEEYTFYVEKTTVKGKPWERLCLGFFSPRSDAVAILKQVQQMYPGAWIQKVSTKNILKTIYSPTGPITGNPQSASKKKSVNQTTGNPSSLTEQQLDSLMQRAKTDFKKKKYSSSIRYLNALVAADNHKYSQEALELLGVARQRNGQKAHAVSTYEKYLRTYPDTEGATRVRQRLDGLLTADKAPKESIHMEKGEEDSSVTSYGSLSQYYRRNSTSTDDAGDIETLSQLITYFDLTTLHRTSNFDHRYQFTSDHVYDFIDSDDDSVFRFIDTFYEFSHRETGSSGRIGRQRLQIGGILKRFDGLSLGYQFTPGMRLNLLGGLPVDIDNKSSLNQHKTFYGITFETGTFLDHWSMNLFYFEQTIDGLTDNNSIGTELRYSDRTKAFYGLLDYDLFYDEINILQLNSNIFFDHGRVAYLNAYMRKLPLLATENALIGRQEQSIEELKTVLNDEQIYQLARDRTANSEMLMIGGSHPLSKSFQITADITFTNKDETEASGGVPATTDTGTDYFFSTQLVGNDLITKTDSYIFGVRYYDTYLTDVASFIINTRFPVTRSWRINPRLQFDLRDQNDGRSQTKLRALIRTDYRYQNKARFDFEIGYDELNDDSSNQSFASNNLFFTLGYRWDF